LGNVTRHIALAFAPSVLVFAACRDSGAPLTLKFR